ncbi:MAG: ComEC/Rec2 family competence protein [Candidatus Melainabacteria bacterium]|nr:ComEC/Rec2 family competence protein [Candidatus Melainabacteria bacterium]
MKAPIVTVIGSLSFASGCLIVAANSDRLSAGREFVSQTTKENSSTLGIFLWQILACFEICWPLILLACVAGFVILYLAERKLAARVLMVLPLLAVVYSTWRLPRPAELDVSKLTYMGNIECVCTVESLSGKNSLICRSSKLVFPGQKVLEGKTLVTISGGRKAEPFKQNQVIQVFGKVSHIHQTNSSWQRNTGHKLISAGIFSKITTDSNQIKLLSEGDQQVSVVEQASHRWSEFWESGRAVIVHAHKENLGTERGALLASMVLGDRVVKLPDNLKDLFRTVGLSHLLAASGFNLSIVVACSYFCARLLPIPAYGAVLSALLSTASFVCLAGPSPSVLRAALLAVLFLIAKLFFRRLHALAALSLTLMIALAVNPLCIADVGLQLSYVATAGIISGLQWVSRQPVDGLHRRMACWFRDTVSVICLAQLSVLPLQLLYFRSAGCLFLPANLLVDPVVAPVTVVGFISSIGAFALSLLPFGIAGSSTLIALMDSLTSLALDYMIGCTSLLAKLEGMTLHFSPPVPGAVATYYLCFIYFLYNLSNRHMRMLGLIALVIGLSLLFFRPNSPSQITYLSKNTALTIDNKTALVLSGDKLDWLSKQLLSYTGSDRISRQLPDEITTTYFDEKQNPFQASTLELSDFVLVSAKPGNNFKSKRRTSQYLRKPLTWSQMKKVVSSLRQKKAKKPTVLWTQGKATMLRQYWDETDIYIASVNQWNPLLLAKSKRNSNALPATNADGQGRQPQDRQGKDDRRNERPRQDWNATATKDSGSVQGSAPPGKSKNQDSTSKRLSQEFYPFRVKWQCGELVVLE